jgi:3-methyladenine DNA glycosylase/8-oxoguanine DNA glycosylase
VTRAERAAALIEAFARTYPDAHCELDFGSPLELLVATILSAQCTDKRVNIVTKELFRVCRTAQDYAEIAPAKLEKIIQSTGFFRAKAKSIRAAVQTLSLSTVVSAAHDGSAHRAARRRSEDCQRRPRKAFESTKAWWSIRTSAVVRAAWTNPADESREDRARI